MRSDLFAQNMVGTPSGHAFTLQNSMTCRVSMSGGEVLARAGSMVAYDGYIQFAWERPNLAQALMQQYTKEGMLLMRCSGQGELFLADRRRDVHLLYLEQEGLTLNGESVLAFEPSIQWEIARLEAPMALSNQGMWNVVLQGTGWVAVTSIGPPVVMAVTPSSRVFVDPDAIIAWSTNLRLSFEQQIMLTNAWMPAGKSGEELQLRVEGVGGYVLVQPCEVTRRGRRKGG
jgi:uncharacterized protein (AIM24 family)